MQHAFKRASLLRQLLAVVYDFLLIAALWLLVGSIFVALNNGSAPNNPWVRYGLLFPSLIAVTWGFYAGFWLKGGQTLGMRAWKIRVIRSDGKAMTINVGLLRCAYGSVSWLLIGLGYLYALINSNGDTLHDKLSKTCVVLTDTAGSPL